MGFFLQFVFPAAGFNPPLARPLRA